MLRFINIILIFALLKSNFAVPATEVIAPEDSNELSKIRIVVLAEMQKKILELQLNVSSAWSDEHSDIQSAKELIRETAKVAEESARADIKQLDEEVKNAKKSARKNRTNIKSCLNQERRARNKLQPRSIRNCRETCSFNVAELKLTELLSVSTDSATYIPSCTLLNPFNNTALEQCIQSRIDQSNVDIETIVSQIDDESSDVQQRAEECIQDTLGNLDLQIESVQTDFEDCVKSSYELY